MIVKNILAGKGDNVITINPTADVIAAAKLMAERRIESRLQAPTSRSPRPFLVRISFGSLPRIC